MPSDTREKILQAAFTVLSRDGYENASIKEIAEEAGVAQGLVHYYFKSKQLLVLAVLNYVCREIELDEAQGAAGALAAFDFAKRALRDQVAMHALYVELIGVGLHDAEIGEGVRQFIRNDRQKVERIATTVFAEREQDPSPARGLAGAVWGAILGIIVQSLVDKEFNADEAVDALAAMSLSAVFSNAQSA